ncbi:hypothetical protein GE21DRAFT_1272287 [Neurospora crassa]|nr:hypothetical protein GE21DRAFT_1272287 [Neurospora crassa]
MSHESTRGALLLFRETSTKNGIDVVLPRKPPLHCGMPPRSLQDPYSRVMGAFWLWAPRLFHPLPIGEGVDKIWDNSPINALLPDPASLSSTYTYLASQKQRNPSSIRIIAAYTREGFQRYIPDCNCWNVDEIVNKKYTINPNRRKFDDLYNKLLNIGVFTSLKISSSITN